MVSPYIFFTHGVLLSPASVRGNEKLSRGKIQLSLIVIVLLNLTTMINNIGKCLSLLACIKYHLKRRIFVQVAWNTGYSLFPIIKFSMVCLCGGTTQKCGTASRPSKQALSMYGFGGGLSVDCDSLLFIASFEYHCI